MITVDSWQIATLIVLALGCTLAAYVVGREDHRQLARLRRVWRAEVREELRESHEAGLDLAERRGAAKARAECGCAEADRLAREARTEITELRGQVDVLARRIRDAQKLADRPLVKASDLSRVLNGAGPGDREPAV